MYCKTYRSILNDLQPRMKDYDVQKENLSCPKKKAENKFVEWLTGGLTKWMKKWMSILWLNYLSESKFKIMATTLRTSPTPSPKKKPNNLKLPERSCSRVSVLCSKDVLYQGTSTSSSCKTTCISKPVTSQQFYLPRLRKDLWYPRLPLCPQAHSEIKAPFEDGPTNKLNYFCYAIPNGEKAQNSRWTII